MSLVKAFATLLFCLGYAVPLPALGWGAIGHRVVGLTADQKLSIPAGKAVRGIMKSGSLSDVANWMDQVRDKPEGKGMDPWHFDSIQVCKPAGAPCTKDNCATRRIALAIETLKGSKDKVGKQKSSKDKDDELKALRVLVHLVGDIHQPLHAAENGDHGANFVATANRKCTVFNKKTQQNEVVNCKLHSYWDNSLVKLAMGKRSEKQFALELAKKDVSVKGDATEWIMESNALAKTKVHTYDKFACATQDAHTTVMLPDGYDGIAVPTVTAQLAKAGQRLADILNNVYK